MTYHNLVLFLKLLQKRSNKYNLLTQIYLATLSQSPSQGILVRKQYCLKETFWYNQRVKGIRTERCLHDSWRSLKVSLRNYNKRMSSYSGKIIRSIKGWISLSPSITSFAISLRNQEGTINNCLDRENIGRPNTFKKGRKIR